MPITAQENSRVSSHYRHGNLLEAIEDSLEKIGKTTQTVTVEDLGPVDEFHVGGRPATESFLARLAFPREARILDVGCGLGGAARLAVTRYGVRVSGVDLTPEYVSVGNTLNRWLGLDGLVELREGSALTMPYDDGSFEGGYMLHVGMNIREKEALFSEVHRVLATGSLFGVYDVMRTAPGHPSYPVPWAAGPDTSHLAAPDEYRTALELAGFEVAPEINRRKFALEFFKALKAKTQAAGGPPPLGLHVLMQSGTPVKIGNMIAAINAGIVAPVEMIGRKR